MKFNKYLILFSLIFILIISVSAVSANDLQSEDISTVELSDVSDESITEVGETVVGSANGFTGIQQAINNAKVGDTIYLKGHYKGSKVIEVNKSITIVGKEYALLNASSTGGAFIVTAKNVTIKNLNFINKGYYEHNGVVDQGYYGAINWQGDHGTLINCNFTDCTSYGAGGAILWAHDYGNIIDCNFVNCRSYEGGGAISWSSYEGNISNCNFTNCNSFGLYQFGGAINNWGSNSKISNCNFLIISALNGAAIYNDPDSDSCIEVINSSFFGCTGAIGIPLYGCTAIDCIFEEGSSNYKTIIKNHVKLVPTSYKSYYKSTKKFSVKLINTITGDLVSGAKLMLKVKVNKSYKTFYATSGSNGVANFNIASLPVGTYTVVTISSANSNIISASVKSKIVISKATTTIKAPKVTNKYKKSKYFKVIIKNKNTGKVISGLKIKIKVYTGKKYKIYTVKTNSKGIASLNTKSLKKGSHKVVITSANTNYSVSKSGYLIKIK